jgi:hypothetical protein
MPGARFSLPISFAVPFALAIWIALVVLGPALDWCWRRSLLARIGVLAVIVVATMLATAALGFAFVP